MTWGGLVWANLWRRRARTVFTLLSVFTAFLLFSVLASTRQAFIGGLDLLGDERLVSIHRSGLIFSLPMAYRQRIAAVDGVAAVSWGVWLQGYWKEQRNFVPLIAVDDEILEMYPEIVVPPEQAARWKETRTGAIVGKTIAERNGWKVGDIVPLRSGIWAKADGSNTWEFEVSAIYDVTSKVFDTESVWVRYDYFNEGRSYERDTVGWYIIKLADVSRGAEVAKSIDALFANSARETKSSAEKAFNEGFVGQFGNIGKIVTYVVSAVFFSMLLVTASTMAQSVRERTAELAVLKALGFSERGVFGLVLGEALAITLLGALLGLGLGWWLCEGLALTLSRFLPAFELTGEAMALGAAAAALLGLVSGLWPAWRAMRMRMVDALREA
jgi:putative ABC transport system permease protein